MDALLRKRSGYRYFDIVPALPIELAVQILQYIPLPDLVVNRRVNSCDLFGSIYITARLRLHCFIGLASLATNTQFRSNMSGLSTRALSKAELAVLSLQTVRRLRQS